MQNAHAPCYCPGIINQELDRQLQETVPLSITTASKEDGNTPVWADVECKLHLIRNGDVQMTSEFRHGQRWRYSGNAQTQLGVLLGDREGGQVAAPKVSDLAESYKR